MTISIPNQFVAERSYIINVLFNEFLGIPYKLKVTDNSKNYSIILNSEKKIIFRDSFFSKFAKGSCYLKKENMPNDVRFVTNKFCLETDIPVIFGDESMVIKSKQIECGIDIFASSFFMLSRWEEYINKNRDQYNRFPAKESLACKYNFIERPIVNEYVEMLWAMLKSLGYKGKRKLRKYQITITHDVDIPVRWRGLFFSIIIMGGDIIKRKSIKLAIKNLKNYFISKIDYRKDPFYNFDFFMDLSEKIGVKSHFFFMSGGGDFKEENFYKINTPFIRKLISHIESRGHLLGFHPSYYTYNNMEIWRNEYEELLKNSNSEIKSGRQHFLRFEVPTTWQIWEDNKMDWDSSVYYLEKPGFRCGTCYEYSVFNILSRKKLKLKERPLIAMESSFFHDDISPSEIEKRMDKLVKTTQKYQGNFVFLWHNSSFNTHKWQPIQYIYKEIVNKFSN